MEPYREIGLDHVGDRVDILPISGLTRRMIQCFWPLVVGDAFVGISIDEGSLRSHLIDNINKAALVAGLLHL